MLNRRKANSEWTKSSSSYCDASSTCAVYVVRIGFAVCLAILTTWRRLTPSVEWKTSWCHLVLSANLLTSLSLTRRDLKENIWGHHCKCDLLSRSSKRDRSSWQCNYHWRPSIVWVWRALPAYPLDFVGFACGLWWEIALIWIFDDLNFCSRSHLTRCCPTGMTRALSRCHLVSSCCFLINLRYSTWISANSTLTTRHPIDDPPHHSCCLMALSNCCPLLIVFLNNNSITKNISLLLIIYSWRVHFLRSSESIIYNGRQLIIIY